MKLSNCKIGTIVKDRSSGRIGHVVGLMLNDREKVIPIIQFPTHNMRATFSYPVEPKGLMLIKE